MHGKSSRCFVFQTQTTHASNRWKANETCVVHSIVIHIILVLLIAWSTMGNPQIVSCDVNICIRLTYRLPVTPAAYLTTAKVLSFDFYVIYGCAASRSIRSSVQKRKNIHNHNECWCIFCIQWLFTLHGARDVVHDPMDLPAVQPQIT
jgi:hypothetical protein